jgi:hypothetical protein
MYTCLEEHALCHGLRKKVVTPYILWRREYIFNIWFISFFHKLSWTPSNPLLVSSLFPFSLVLLLSFHYKCKVTLVYLAFSISLLILNSTM